MLFVHAAYMVQNSVVPKQIGKCNMLATQALLQTHTNRLEQQQQAQAQQLTLKHVSDLQSTVATLQADHRQQMQAEVEQASSKHAGQVVQTQQQLQKVEALLATEKQKNVSLKVMLSLLRMCLVELFHCIIHVLQLLHHD